MGNRKERQPRENEIKVRTNANQQSRDETASLEPRVSVVEGHDSSLEFVIVEGWTRKDNGARNQLKDYRFERENFDDARNYFWSQVFNDKESLWRLIDYANTTPR